MGGNKWTEEQKRAIETRGCNLLVAAAAGAGKTAVLVERIIRIVTNETIPMDIDKLLVVTFTNAAAAEMRERIAAAISEGLYDNPSSKQLQRQLTLLNKASITTIHSFCLQVIKNNFHKIDLDPAFRIGDETETVLLKQEALDELMEESYEDENFSQDFADLIESYSSNKSDSAIAELILNLYEFTMSSPYPEEWLSQSTEAFNVPENFDFGQSSWAKVLISNIQIELTGLKKALEMAIQLIESEATIHPYLENFQEDLALINDMILASHNSWESLQEIFQNASFGKLNSCRNVADKDKQKRVQKLRDNVKDQIKAIKAEAFGWSSDEVASELRELYPRMHCLYRLIMDFHRRYKEKKRRRGIIDFNDIEHFCLEILVDRDENNNIVPSHAALSLRDKFEEILIDEYQDSNLVQEVILTSISRKDSEVPNLFMVGDVKQSIYRFRQAKPELFLEKYNTYSDEEGQRSRRILLYKNFRSRSEIIEGTNFIFKQIMSENIGELDYNDREALNVGADYSRPENLIGITGGPIELHIIEKKTPDIEVEGNDSAYEDGGGEDQEENLDNVTLEARVVSYRINSLLNPKNEENVFKVFDKHLKEYRPLQFKDIVILLRATSQWAPVFMEELKNAGIPVYADTGTGYFETTEIKTMLSLLQVIDNPMQDIPLLAVLRSPVGAFSPEELIDIRLLNREGTFYECMKKVQDICQFDEHLEVCFSEHKDMDKVEHLKAHCESCQRYDKVISEGQEKLAGFSRELCRKINYFLKTLRNWRDKALHMDIDEFIWFLYTETGYYGYAGAMPGGEQRQANLRVLFQRARQFEQTSFRGLFNFVNFINRLRVSSGDMGSAKTLGENDNVVRIMSIHKSKGLEFPVVFLSGIGKSFNTRDTAKSILFHHSLGIGPDYVDYRRRIAYPTILKQAIKKKIKIESLSEEMRILYVALTRAKEKLIITGEVNDIEKSISKWQTSMSETGEKLSEDTILRGKSYLEWIAPALVRHKDAATLRGDEASETSANLIESDSSWEISLLTREEISKGELFKDKPSQNLAEAEAAHEVQEQSESGTLSVESIDHRMAGQGEEEKKYVDEKDLREKYTEEIERRLSYRYAYSESTSMPAKISVSELKRMFSASDEEAFSLFTPELVKKPSFLEESKGLSSSEKGTAMHAVMQHLDLKSGLTESNIKAQIHSMVEREIITKAQGDTVRFRKIAQFFQSELGKRMLKSEDLRRETTFQIQLKSSQVYKHLPEKKYDDELILLQGAIDCFFEEEGQLVLVDYKTDYVEDGDVEPIKERYKVQLYYYEKALERITGKNVKEKYLYLFSTGETVRME